MHQNSFQTMQLFKNVPVAQRKIRYSLFSIRRFFITFFFSCIYSFFPPFDYRNYRKWLEKSLPAFFKEFWMKNWSSLIIKTSFTVFNHFSLLKVLNLSLSVLAFKYPSVCSIFLSFHRTKELVYYCSESRVQSSQEERIYSPVCFLLLLGSFIAIAIFKLHTMITRVFNDLISLCIIFFLFRRMQRWIRQIGSHYIN